MDTIELAADVRQDRGKRNRFLRRQGLTPANVYGTNVDSLSIQLQTRALEQALVQGGRNAVINVKVNGEPSPRTAVIRGVQLHPVTDALVHVDLMQVDINRPITAEVPLVLVGQSPLSAAQTIISQTLSTLGVEGRPLDLPRQIEVDISVLAKIDQAIRVRDLTFPAAIRVLTDPDVLIVRAAPIRAAEVEETPTEVPVQGEVEVIKAEHKEKAEEEEAEEGEEKK